MNIYDKFHCDYESRVIQKYHENSRSGPLCYNKYSNENSEIQNGLSTNTRSLIPASVIFASDVGTPTCRVTYVATCIIKRRSRCIHRCMFQRMWWP